MERDEKQDALLMAILVLSRKDVLAGAGELGISEELVTDDLIELVKERVAEELNGWRVMIQEMVKKVINRDIMGCPLGMDCTSSCIWREVGECTLVRKPE